MNPTQTLLEILRKRRSIKQENLSPEAFPHQWLEEMLEAANWAPSHGQTEPWRFWVFTGEARRALGETFAESYRLLTPPEAYKAELEEAQRSRVWKAPVWIGLGMQPSGRQPEWEEIAAAAMAVQNIQLVAASRGLGAFWTSGRPVLHENTARFVGLEAPAKLLGFLYVGKPAGEWPQGKRGDWRDKITFYEK